MTLHQAATRSASRATRRCARSTWTRASTTRRGACARRWRSCSAPTPTRCSSTSSTSRRASCAPRRGSPTRCGRKNVFHPEEDRYIGAIFAAVWQAVALLEVGRAQAVRAQAQGQARPGDRPGAVLEGVQLRLAGAEHLAAGGLLPAGAAGRHAARQHEREGRAHSVAGRRRGAPAGSRRQGARVPARAAI